MHRFDDPGRCPADLARESTFAVEECTTAGPMAPSILHPALEIALIPIRSLHGAISLRCISHLLKTTEPQADFDLHFMNHALFFTIGFARSLPWHLLISIQVAPTVFFTGMPKSSPASSTRS
jgi:hypothetical protein